MDSKCLFKRKIGKGATIINNVHPSSTDDDQPTCKKHLVTIKTSQSLGEWKRFFSFSLDIQLNLTTWIGHFTRPEHSKLYLPLVNQDRRGPTFSTDRQTDLDLWLIRGDAREEKLWSEGLAKSSLNCLWFSRKIKSLQVPSLFRIITPSTETILGLQQTDYKFILVLIGTVLTSLIGNARPYT